MIRTRLLVAVALVTLAACSGDGGDAETSTTTPAASTVAGSDGPADGDAGDDSPESTDPVTETTDLRPGVVAFDGSVESLILELPDARNFATGVEEWLTAVPGQEGVFRNSRGITVFVPVDRGFSESDREEAFADPDIAAVTIGHHLHVGALDEFDGSVDVASGAEYTIGGDGATIAGRRVLRIETATNGVVYLIDGPLTGDAG